MSFKITFLINLFKTPSQKIYLKLNINIISPKKANRIYTE